MARFRVKPYGEPRRPQSPAQKAATERAFRIFRLRGLWCQAYLLTGERREQAQAAVDAELALLGAATQAEHAEAVRASFSIPDNGEDFAEVELPF